jgi:hypothetical protein
MELIHVVKTGHNKKTDFNPNEVDLQRRKQPINLAR